MSPMSDERSTAYDAFGTPTTVGRDRADTRAVFGQVMGLVAITVGFAALGAYLGKDMSRGAGWIAFFVAIGCLLGLNAVAARSEPLAITLLFVVGLALGLMMGPLIGYYLNTNPGVVYQSAGATGLFVGGLGAFGYATKRDLSSWSRVLFWSLLALIVFGLVTIFVSIPGGRVIYALLGLGVFGAYTIFDFNRLRRAGMESAVPIAAGIFLDVINIFQFFLLLFGGGRR
jgi:FtsH-binding integral membrane protein